MSALMMSMQRNVCFGSAEQAQESLAALAGALGAANRLGSIWTRFRGVVLPLNLETIALLLVECRSIRADTAGRPTHVIPLNGLPAGSGEIGQISITVRQGGEPPTKPGAGVGLKLSVNLPDACFNSDTDALLRLLGGCFDTALADSGAIGPRALVKELGMGWATATRRTGRDWLPSGITLVPIRTGSVVVAHREEPGVTSASARDAVVRVHHALNGTSPQTSVPIARAEPIPMPRQESIPLPIVSIPIHSSPLAAARPPTPVPPAFWPSSDLAGTISVASLPIPHRPPADPLPFGITPSSEFVASLAAVRPATPHSEVGETLPLGANMLSAMLPALPFNHAGTAPPPVAGKFASAPQLTLDAYASLCAELSVFPARTIDILQKYGVVDDSMRRELDQRWRDLFTTAPPLRDEWQRKVTSFSDWLRRGGR